MKQDCDALVIGHGVAGCVAASVMASKGLRTVLVGDGPTATSMSAGRPLIPDAPESGRLAKWFVDAGGTWGLFQRGSGERDVMTSIGTVVKQSLHSSHEWSANEAPAAAVGIMGDPDLDPDLLSSWAASSGRRVSAYWTDLGNWRALGEGEAADALASALADLKEETAVIPPLFPGRDREARLLSIEAKSGRKVREALTPLSVPGRRLQGCLEDAAAASGCQVLKGRRVEEIVMDGREAVCAIISSGMRTFRISGMRAVVLAPGGLAVGGLAVDGSDVREPLLGLDVREKRVRTPRCPLLRAAMSSGVAVKDHRPTLADGTLAGNVFVAGSVAAGMSFPSGKGLGHAALDAMLAADAALEATG